MSKNSSSKVFSKTYAIFSNDIDDETDPKNFLSTVTKNTLNNYSDLVLDKDLMLIIVTTPDDLIHFTTKDIAITGIDKNLYSTHKNDIVNYISNNLQANALDLSDIPSKFPFIINFRNKIIRLSTILIITGAWINAEDKNLTSIDLSNNDIEVLKFSFKIVFPQLYSIDFSNNEILNKDRDPCYGDIKFLNSKPPSNKPKISPPMRSKPIIQTHEIKSYGIFNKNISNDTDPKIFLSTLTKDQLNCDKFFLSKDPDLHIIIVKAPYNLVPFNNSDTGITAVDINILEHYRDNIINYASKSIDNDQLDLSNISQKFSNFYNSIGQLYTILFIVGAWSCSIGKNISSIDLSNNSIPSLKFSFHIFFPNLKSINFYNNKIIDAVESLKDDKLYENIEILNMPPANTQNIISPPTKHKEQAQSSKRRTYAIYNKNISDEMNIQDFLINLTNNRAICEGLDTLVNQQYHLLFVKSSIDFVPFHKPDTAITSFDYDFFEENRINIITYASRNIKNGCLNLCGLKKKTCKDIIQFVVILFTIGIWSVYSDRSEKITMIDMSDNDIKFLFCDLNLLFPDLTTIDFSKNPIAEKDDLLNEFFGDYQIIQSKDESSPPSIRLPLNPNKKNKLIPHQPPSSNQVQKPLLIKLDSPSSDYPQKPESNLSQSPSSDNPQKPKPNLFQSPSSDNPQKPKPNLFQSPSSDDPQKPKPNLFQSPSSDDLQKPKPNLFQSPSSDDLQKPNPNLFQSPSSDNIQPPASNPPQHPQKTESSSSTDEESSLSDESSSSDKNSLPAQSDVNSLPTQSDENLHQYDVVSPSQFDDINFYDEEEEEEESELSGDQDIELYEYSEDEDILSDETKEEEETYQPKEEQDLSSKKKSSKDIQQKKYHNIRRHEHYQLHRPEYKALEEPIHRRLPVPASFSEFNAIKLDIHDFPPHQFMSSFFYDSWQQIETIGDYYSFSSIFSLSVQIKSKQEEVDCPSLYFYKKFSRNLLLPDTNIAIGSSNIARAQSDYLFVNGFKAKPLSVSFFQVDNTFFYVFHGVFESDLLISYKGKTQRNIKEVLLFDRSFTIQFQDTQFVITNDNLLIHMMTY